MDARKLDKNCMNYRHAEGVAPEYSLIARFSQFVRVLIDVIQRYINIESLSCAIQSANSKLQRFVENQAFNPNYQNSADQMKLVPKAGYHVHGSRVNATEFQCFRTIIRKFRSERAYEDIFSNNTSPIRNVK